jgi:hypothetical protein
MRVLDRQAVQAEAREHAACPCGAVVGAKCVDRWGLDTVFVHVDRYEAAGLDFSADAYVMDRVSS